MLGIQGRQGICSPSPRCEAEYHTYLHQRDSRHLLESGYRAGGQRHCHHSRSQPKFACQAAAGSTKRYPELEKIVEEKSSGGVEKPIQISFREVNTFNLWIWFELYKLPAEDDVELLETVLESWYVLGRLGGFNGMNLQISQNVMGQASYYRYNEEDTESATSALFMNYGPVESQGRWCRFWVNMGTADELALDILINALSVFSKENLGIKQLIIGGVNDDWSVPDLEHEALEGLNDPSQGQPS